LAVRIPDDARLATLLQHFGEEEKILGAVTPPLFQNSLFVFDDARELAGLLVKHDDEQPFVYSRISNPTLDVVEKKMAMLEGTESCKIFSAGMMAITAAILSNVNSGDHIVGLDTNYGPTISLFKDFLPRFGVTTTFVDGRNTEELLAAIKPETKVVYLESPSTMFFRLQDLEAIATECKKRGITTICDNSYSSPVFQQPAKFGIDIVVHSASKYLGGHSDITAGVLCTSRARIDKMLEPAGEIPIITGVLAPFSAWLLGRGMRTLELRMKAAEKMGNAIACWLEDRNEVEFVHHPGLPTFPQRSLFVKQMRGSGSLLSFEPKQQDREKALDFVNALRIFQRGVSWGGFESLAIAAMPQPMDYKEPRNLIRLYCGLEDPADLIADLEQAFRVSGL
jgi:cystathionine beta-lyase/cystathionine gamma-synthase